MVAKLQQKISLINQFLEYMKAIRIHNFGGAESLQVDDVNIPEYGDNQVLIKVHNACVNLLDLKIASGAMQQFFPVTLPWIPGLDFSGTIEAVGSEVKGFSKGDIVYGFSQSGAYSEHCLIFKMFILFVRSALRLFGCPALYSVSCIFV